VRRCFKIAESRDVLSRVLAIQGSIPGEYRAGHFSPIPINFEIQQLQVMLEEFRCAVILIRAQYA
jgi:hypothetical protein